MEIEIIAGIAWAIAIFGSGMILGHKMGRPIKRTDIAGIDPRVCSYLSGKLPASAHLSQYRGK
jgi:hypothetical protein